MKKFVLILVSLSLIYFIYNYFSFGVSFDKKIKEDNEYKVVFLDQTRNQNVYIKDFINKNCTDLCLIKSKEKIDESFYKDFFSYDQFLNINLLVISKYKLGKNKTKMLEPFLMPVYTGYVYFQKRKVLFSFLPSFFKEGIKINKQYNKIVIRRITNRFRNRTIPRIIMTNWHFSYAFKKELLKYSKLKYIRNKNFLKINSDFNIYKSDNIKVFQKTEKEFQDEVLIGGNI